MIALVWSVMEQRVCSQYRLEERAILTAGGCPGLSMGMGFPWESHGKCPMGWDGMGLHALHFPWDLWDSSHVIAF